MELHSGGLCVLEEVVGPQLVVSWLEGSEEPRSGVGLDGMRQ
jgi:hypothetical protein